MAKEADANIYDGLGITEVMERCHELIRWADLEMLISDAARWCCFGEYVIGDKAVKITHWKKVPEPFELRYENHIALPPGVMYKPMLAAYDEIYERVFGTKSKILKG
jgi:hypothetical protein